jgi:indole-3-glycerol phosphate synthase
MRAGIRGFLIGEALVAASDIGTTLRGFLGR